MNGRRVLVTGGAGFVGSSLAIALQQRGRGVLALDNLRRRGSELNLARLRAAGVEFVHGDVRSPSDLHALAPLDAIVECSAEPSALAGSADGATHYPVQTNLFGAWHCLELARREQAQLIFLSSSRVYPISALCELNLETQQTRLALSPHQHIPGASEHGVAEDFPLAGARTLYGATKLAAELLIAEYREAFGLQTVINRCGVIAGPWQMGKAEQGVFAHWVLAHRFGLPLRYLGHQGRQVRDLLHVDDLTELIDEQLSRPDHWDGITANVGGGTSGSLSLREATELCRTITGRSAPLTESADERPGDVPLYISDCRRLHAHTGWRPRRDPRQILADIDAWAGGNEAAIRVALGI
jgi:CDP-paratose 2-epimerase